MRLFTTATILAAFLVFSFTPNPASASKKSQCVSLIKRAEGLIDVAAGKKFREKIEEKLLDARAFQEAGKHGKCVKKLKKFVKKNLG